MRDELYSKRRFKNGQFPTYKTWVKGYIQSTVLGSSVSAQGIVDITPNLPYEYSGSSFINKKTQENKKLSTKERLRKKLLEKKRKEVEEMLKRL